MEANLISLKKTGLKKRKEKKTGLKKNAPPCNPTIFDHKHAHLKAI